MRNTVRFLSLIQIFEDRGRGHVRSERDDRAIRQCQRLGPVRVNWPQGLGSSDHETPRLGASSVNRATALRRPPMPQEWVRSLSATKQAICQGDPPVEVREKPYIALDPQNGCQEAPSIRIQTESAVREESHVIR